MKFDISKLSFDEAKHRLGVFLQMGRVQLDSDWNEQSEIWLRLLQRHAHDAVGTGSPNHGFRVGERILLDALDSLAGWTATPAGATLFVDYFLHRVGEGSLVVEGATELVRTLERPLDLTGLEEVVFSARDPLGGSEELFLEQGGSRFALPANMDADDVEGWRIFRAAVGAPPAGFDLAAVEAYGFQNLQAAVRYQLDTLEVDLPIRGTLVPTLSAPPFALEPLNAGDVPRLAINDDDRLWRSTVLEVSDARRVSYPLPAPRDLSRARRLVFAARSSTAGATLRLKLVDENDAVATASPQVTLGAADTWQIETRSLPGGIDLAAVKEVRWDNLSADEYLLSPVLVEMDLDDDLVVQGGDGTAAGAGRFYGDGLAAVKESHETYFSQHDLPEPDSAPFTAPAAGNCRVDLAYLDLWERPVTYLEEPGIREVALEGPDTCTRTRLVAQVRILTGQEFTAGGDPPMAALLGDFAALPTCGGGTLTTKDKPDAVLDPCADPCEPEVAGTFVGEANRLYRVEIHTCGDVGAEGAAGTATFKWSKENGATATALVADGAAGTHSVTVEKPELFAVGDLIEVSDDRVDLVTGPFEDTVDHRCHQRGELRRITGINLQDRRLSWEDAGAADPTYHGPLAETYYLAYRAKVRRWDGLLSATAGDIVLDDGVVIELGGEDFVPGDYWVFTTRTVDRSVERLIEAPPRGLCHRYYKLATITRCNAAGEPSVVVEDCRETFNPLTALEATDVAFDPGRCAGGDPAWAEVENVQEAIELLCGRTGGGGHCTATVGDGTISHGEFTSIQAAIDSLDGHGGVVCILRGDHFVSETVDVPDDVVVRGAGPATRIAFLPGDAGGPLFRVRNAERVRFEDLFAVTAAGDSLIRLEETRDVRISRCTLVNTRVRTVEVHEISNVTLGAALRTVEDCDGVGVEECRLAAAVAVHVEDGRCRGLSIRRCQLRAPLAGLLCDRIDRMLVRVSEIGGFEQTAVPRFTGLGDGLGEGSDLAALQAAVDELLQEKAGMTFLGYYANTAGGVTFLDTGVSALIGLMPLLSVSHRVERCTLTGGVNVLLPFGVLFTMEGSGLVGLANVVQAGLYLGLELESNQLLGLFGVSFVSLQLLVGFVLPALLAMAGQNGSLHGGMVGDLGAEMGPSFAAFAAAGVKGTAGIGAAALVTVRDNLFLSATTGLVKAGDTFSGDFTVAGNRFYLCTGHGVLLEAGESLFGSLGRSVPPAHDLTENHFATLGIGVESHVTDTRVVDNYLKVAGANAVRLHSDRCTASGNTVEMESEGDAEANDAAVLVGGGVSQASVRGNRIAGGRGSGIVLGGFVFDVAVEDNGIERVALNGITASGPAVVSHQLVVRGNRITGCVLHEAGYPLWQRGGIVLADGAQVSISDNRIWQNGVGQEAPVHGIWAEDLAHSVIAGNQVWANGGSGGSLFGSGVTLLNARQDVQILGNDVSQNRGFGIRVMESSGNFLFDLEVLDLVFEMMAAGGAAGAAPAGGEAMLAASEPTAGVWTGTVNGIFDYYTSVQVSIRQAVTVDGNAVEGSIAQSLIEIVEVERLVFSDNRVLAVAAANADVPVRIRANHLICTGNHVEAPVGGNGTSASISPQGSAPRMVIGSNVLSGSTGQLPSGIGITTPHNLFF